MFSPGDKTPRVGRVSIDVHGKSYRLRFTYPEGSNHSFSIARATPEGWTTAIKAAQLINRDIDLDDFDDTYARYSPRHARKLKKQQAKETKKQYNLIDLWQEYKKMKSEQIAESTKIGLWKDCDRYLEQTPSELLKMDKAHEFLSNLESRYAVSTIATLFRSCLKPAVNMAVKRELIEANPYDDLIIPKAIKKSPECFGSIRSHWGVENQLHWCLDMVFSEDDSRIRKDHAPQNMTILKRLALNLLRQDNSKGSLKMKRYQAGLNNNFLLQILSDSGIF